MSVIAHQTEKEWISANKKSRQRMSQTQAEVQLSNMQTDLRMHICEHIIRVLQHQKDVNQKHICIKHDFCGEQSHNNSQLASRYNPVEDSRFRQHVLIYTMMEVYPLLRNVLDFKGRNQRNVLYH
ncbi:hypothetical protein TNCV_3378191 [Trichonephila clavipes]|nr:hypothetical protein TNCV_3378191 [Trichonephila clavipes]